MYEAKIYPLQENGCVGNWNQFETINFTAEPNKKDNVIGKAEVKKALKGKLKGMYVEVRWAGSQTVEHPLYIFKNN